MSEGCNKSFLSDPVKFAKEHILYIIKECNSSVKQRSEYQAVSSSDRVVYWNIRSKKEGDNSTYCGIEFSPSYQRGYKPGFWLPYQDDTVRKITLVDKRYGISKHFYGEAQAFFTSTLSGCTIVFSGSTENPTVYHINAGNYNGLETKRDEYILDKWRSIRPAKRLFNVGIDEYGLKCLVHHAHIIKPSMYRDIPKMEYEEEITDTEYITTAQAATVFGIKGKYGWEFYAQKIKIRKYNGTMAFRKEYFNEGIIKLWPKGPGQFITGHYYPVYK